MSPEVDIIVGAHSHSFLNNGDGPDGSRPVGEYPSIVTQENGHRVSNNLLEQNTLCSLP